MKIGIVGLGKRVATVYAFLKEMHAQAELVGYVDPAPAGLPTLTQLGLKTGTAYPDLQDLLEQQALDLLMIGSPNFLHLEHLKIGLEAGVTIFAEKPIVSNEPQTWELAELLQKHGSKNIYMDFPLRSQELVVRLKEFIDQGILGEVISIEASEHIMPFHGAFFMRDWRRLSKYAGSFLLEKCCHDLDLYQSIVGALPKFVSSFGGRRNFVPKNKHKEQSYDFYQTKTSGWQGTNAVFDSDADIVDHQVMIVNYANGVCLAFHTNANVPDEFRRFCIMGTDGMAEGDLIRNFLTVHDLSGKRIFNHQYARDKIYSHYSADRQMVQGLLQWLLEQKPQPSTIIDAMISGLTAMKADEARLQNQVVDMQSVWEKFNQYQLTQNAQ